MIFIVLLRGINVGGNNTVSMAELKEALERLGCKNVRTYINSGNVILSDSRNAAELHAAIEGTLKKVFGFEISALVLGKSALDRIALALPADWRNDTIMRCDVLFLWNDKNTPSVIKEIPAKPGIDNVKYVDGALLWSIARNNVTKSGLPKLIGTDLYKKMTIRNCNTVRKLAELATKY